MMASNLNDDGLARRNPSDMMDQGLRFVAIERLGRDTSRLDRWSSSITCLPSVELQLIEAHRILCPLFSLAALDVL